MGHFGKAGRENLSCPHNANRMMMRFHKHVLAGSLSVAALISTSAQDGTLDLTFNPGDIGNGYGDGADYKVRCTAIQPDGKILIGGDFLNYNATHRNYLARIETNGSLDMGFDPGTGANNSIRSMALQTDGKILIAGAFITYNGTTRNYIARLNTNGSLDAAFNMGTGTNHPINFVGVQTDGKIIIAGEFSQYNGITRHNIARINSDGTLDPSFDPGAGPDNYILCTTIQSDGKIIIGGEFNYYDLIPINNLARLNPDGSLDNSFVTGTGPNHSTGSIDVQSDGKILVGGGFTNYNGTGRNRIMRLLNDISLAAPLDEVGVTTVFPNPAQGNFSFVADLAGPAEISVVDVAGKVVWKDHAQLIQGGTYTLDLGGNNPGIYIMTVQGRDKRENVRLTLD